MLWVHRTYYFLTAAVKKSLKEQSRTGGILLASFRPTVQKYSFKQSHISFLR